MTPDLSITSNRSSVTLPGSEGATTYVKRMEREDMLERGVQATALTYPRTLQTIQQERSPGSRKASRRTVVILKERDLTTIVPQDNGLGGRADGEATVTVTIVRPSAPGYQTTFSAAKIKTLIASAFDVVLQNADALIAGEK